MYLPPLDIALYLGVPIPCMDYGMVTTVWNATQDVWMGTHDMRQISGVTFWFVWSGDANRGLEEKLMLVKRINYRMKCDCKNM